MNASDPILALHRKVGLDITGILRVLPEGNGGGVDIRYAPEVDTLAELRREDIGGSQGVWQTATPKRADWKAVVQQGSTLLATRSKDLQVAVWVVQAVTRLHGMKGLAAGLDMLVRLTNEFWPMLWPRPDGDDLEPRMAPYFWLDSHVTAEVLQVEVTEAPDNRRTGLTFQEIVKGRKLRQLATNNSRAFEEALSEGEMSPDAIGAVVEDSGDLFFLSLAADVAFARRGLTRLRDALDVLGRAEAPSFSALTRILDDVEAFIGGILSERGLVAPGGGDDRSDGGTAADSDADEDAMALDNPFGDDDSNPFADVFGDDDGGSDGDEAAGAAPTRSVGGRAARRAAAGEAFVLPAIANRAEAYRLLDHAADWLLEHEPHSPAPYLVKRAVSWEKASLRAVLLELMARGADSEGILEGLGIDEEGRPAAASPRRGASYG